MRLGRLRNIGLRHRCPLCGWPVRRFLPTVTGRPHAECPHCGSLERHRHLWLYLQRRGLLDRAGRLLHVAPERPIEKRVRGVGSWDYLSVDLEPGRADMVADITSLPFSDGTYDAVLCSHVLEHVPDDSAALKEFHRVLAPGGWAIVQVPILAEATIEDPSETDPAVRKARFGQEDHVRVYGPDFADRLSEAGFQVHADVFRDELTKRQRERWGLRHHLGWLDPDAADVLWTVWRCEAG